MAEAPLWTFAVHTYDRPGVDGALIALQDELGLDVCVVLFCLWLGSQNREIGAVLDAACAVSEDWTPAIAPLRAARRSLKALASGDAGEIAALRERLKASELDAERLELAALARLAAQAHPAPVAGTAMAVAQANLARYFAALNIAPDLLGRAEVLRILAAAFAA